MAAVEFHAWPRTVHVQGSLVEHERVVVGAKVSGRVKEVKVDLGSPVKQGDPLALLEPEDFDYRVEQAEAQLGQALAKLGLKPGESEGKLQRAEVPSVVQEMAVLDEARSNLERALSLSQQNVITAQDLEQRQAEVKVAEARHRSALNTVDSDLAELAMRRAELSLAKQARADAVIVAPFDGIVHERHVAPGAYLQVGQQVATIVRIDPLRFRGGVPERKTLEIDVGQPATIHLEGRAEPIPGQVTRTSPSVDPNNRSQTIEIDVPNPDSRLPAGLFAEAEIVVDPQARSLVVPEAAVTEFAGVQKIRVLRDGKPVELAVETGRRDGGVVEIVSGLAAGEQVVLPPGAESPAASAGKK
jgi:RND family efflux transporter MFP subunit